MPNRRLLDKKIIEISFPQSSIESEDYFYNSYQVETLSSDEETFFENKSEVLWSRERSTCFSEDDFFRTAFNDFSDISGRTASSCSWHNDEFDMKSTNKVRASLEAIDEALYERKRDTSMCEELFQECCSWSKKFPYLRLKGEQVAQSADEGVMSHSTASIPAKPCHQGYNSSYLLVEGKRMTIRNSTQFQSRASLQCSDISPVCPDYVEEVFQDHGQYQECLALDDSELSDQDSLETDLKNNSSFIRDMHEKIIEKLVLLLWPKVLAALQLMKEKNYGEDVHLPPIAMNAEQRQSIYFQRPQTEGKRYTHTDFPKLSDILTVSPKVLQQRKEYRSGSGIVRVPRPTSEISLVCRNSDIGTTSTKLGSCKSFTQQKVKNLTSLNNCRPYSRARKNLEKETDNFQQFLPALEEDSIESSNILQRIHFEPETSELSSKQALSDRFIESSGISLKADSFLPPIEDRNYISNSSKYKKNIFAFYGSHPKSGKSSLASAKVSDISCRSNSSISRNIFTNNTLQQKYVTNHENLSAKKNGNPGNYDNVCDDKEVKAVTLFPIVTSLIPQREKSFSNTKKEGLFGSLVGKKR